MRPFLVFCLLVSGLASAVALEPPPLRTAEQDANGIIWAFSSGESKTAFTFDGKQWTERAIPFSPDEHATAQQAVKLADGAVGCLWSLNKDRMAFTWHRGKESRVIGRCPGEVPKRVRLLADSQNRLWVTGESADIRRIDAKTGSLFEYRVKPEDLTKTFDGGLPRDWNPIRSAEDGRGRIWAWTAMGGPAYGTLRGILLFDGDQVTQRDITGASGTFFTCLVRKDKTHMWLGVLGGGLYEVDIETLEAKPFSGFDSPPFRHIDRVFSVGSDLFVSDYSQAKATLWRFRNAQWERFIEKLDEYPTSEWSWIALEKGIIVSAQPSPWFISNDDRKPVQLDWRNGYPAEKVRKALLCPDGSLFALAEDGTFLHRKKALPSDSDAPSRVTELLEKRRHWTGSPNGHLWAIIEENKNGVLCEWDGESWHDHALPPGKIFAVGSLEVDTSGRVWVLPNQEERMTAYFDSRTGEWQTFEKPEAVFEALKNDPPKFLTPKSPDFIPQYSSDHRHIIFRVKNSRLAYFNGETWTRWKREDIRPGNDNSMGSPGFDEKDRLCVNVGNATWQLDANNVWRETQFDSRFSEVLGPRNDAPDGLMRYSHYSITTDNQGFHWFTWNGELFKSWDKFSTRVFSEDEPNPFGAGRRITQVWVDRKGNAFVQVTTNWMDNFQFQIAPLSKPPKTSLAVAPIKEDRVRLQLGTPSPGKVRFRWRLDDGPWEGAQDRSVVLDSLENGEHTVKAQAFDEKLQCDPVPAEAKFVIKFDPTIQIKELLSRLSDPDFAQRKAAIKALARQPATALAALKAARPEATDDQRWWIDAAIQQIERKASKGTPGRWPSD